MKNIISALVVALAAVFSTAAQNPQTEKTPVREFGWSLEQKLPETAPKLPVKNPEIAVNEDVISVETNLVVNDVFVGNKRGQAIPGLKKSDFIVTEDGQTQKIETFARGDDAAVPRSIVLIMDYSISQLPYLETSVEAAKALVDKLNPQDKMAIVTDDVEMLTTFTDDKTLLKSKLDLLKTKALAGNLGRSLQYSALYVVLNEVFKPEDVRPIIFFQTDGDEDYALKNSGILSSGNLPERNFSFADVMTAAEKSRATIYTIIPGMNYAGLAESAQLEKARDDFESRRTIYTKIGEPAPPKIGLRDGSLLSSVRATLRRQAYLDNLSKSTGGWTSALETPQQAGDVYAEILDQINRRYVIGYYPTNEKRDGKRRTVRIEVRGHPEYVIQGRRTYFAAPR